MQDSGKYDDGGCLVSGERIGFGIEAGFKIQGGATTVVAWFLRKGYDSGFRIQGSAIMVVAWFLR
jgi:hypothetical protein